MKKLLILTVLIALLSGCSRQVEFKKEDMQKAVSKALELEIPLKRLNNCFKSYYSYYLYPEIGKDSGDEISDLFFYDSQSAVMCLDVAGIIARQNYAKEGREYLYLRQYSPQSDVFYDQSGRFLDCNEEIKPYHLYVGVFSETSFLLTIQTADFIVTSIVAKKEVCDMAYEMMKVLRSAVINADNITADFNINVIENSTSSITLFNYTLPENGVLEDYLESWKNDPNFTIYDKEYTSDDKEEGN